MVHKQGGALALVAALLLSTSAFAQDKRVVTWNADYDPIPLAAAEAMILDFEAANPEIDIVLTNFDHEGYKNAIRNFLTADPPDLANWYAANRMRPFVEAGLFADISDLWASEGLNDSLASSVLSMTIDGKQWGIPYTYYQWGIYYNRDAYKAAGLEAPGPEGVTWDQFLANCEAFKAAGIDCVTTGSSALWPAAGIFDYVSMRTNGYQFHSDLAAGKVSWTSPEARAVFENFGKLQPYVTANHAAIDWQDDERADVELSVLETAPGDEIDLADAVARTDESVDLADADIGVDFGDLAIGLARDTAHLVFKKPRECVQFSNLGVDVGNRQCLDITEENPPYVGRLAP